MLACALDLETTGFEADFNIILCAVIKPFTTDNKGKHCVLRADSYPTWSTSRSVDAPLCRDLLKELERYDIIVAHNGVRFDVPFAMARFLKWGLRWPQPKILDPVRLARRYLRLGRNSLQACCHHFGIQGKTECLGDEWMQAKFDRGPENKRAMDYVVTHCIADVDILEKLTLKLKHLSPRIGNFGSDT